MSVRTDILTALIADVKKITVANGYQHTVVASRVFGHVGALDKDLTDGEIIAVILGPDTTENIEAGREKTLKAFILFTVKSVTDTDLAGLMSIETEKWFADFDRLFETRYDTLAEKAKFTALGDVSGVEDFYVSAHEPYADDTKKNRLIAVIELTINIIA